MRVENNMDMRLTITTDEEPVEGFLVLIRAGFKIEARVGGSVKQLLCDQIGLPEEYYEERIQTLFLDTKPVDDAGEAVIKNGSTLALSAAMPGLVGATFRKGGRYSWMRESISYEKNASVVSKKRGWVTLRLFNFILKEQGPFFLSQGVWISGETVQDFLRMHSETIPWDKCRITIDDQKTGVEDLSTIPWNERQVLLKIEAV